ncbi:MAG: LysR family transcriptional regulator [Burkholderiales bacterium PBB3]|nr:MAG: LysR family transcriptional regulator [Burkholderiales bacterium PBB3]
MSKPIPQLPWIELRLWRQFVTVAEELHFGRAALRLHMTQPPLTQAIAQLERSLGVMLFARTKRSVQLTPQGLALLPQAQALLQQAKAVVLDARALAGGESGRLRLAFVSTVGFSILPPWVMAFRQEFPGVQLDLVEATGDVQLQLLQADEVDAGFILHASGFAVPGLQRLTVAQEPLVLALPESHPLAQRKTLRLADVWAQPLVSFPRRIVPSLYDAIFGMYHDAGQLPVVAQEAIQMQTIVNLVSAGLGVAWVPASVQQFQRSGVVYRQVQGAGRGAERIPVPGCETSLVWQRSSPSLQRFMGFANVHNAVHADSPPN